MKLGDAPRSSTAIRGQAALVGAVRHATLAGARAVKAHLIALCWGLERRMQAFV